VSSDQAPVLAVGERWDDGVATVTVRGEIDLSTVDAFHARLAEITRRDPQRLVIDLTEVTFLDSAGLRAFVRARKALPERCPVILRCPQRKIRQVVEMTGLGTVFVFD